MSDHHHHYSVNSNAACGGPPRGIRSPYGFWRFVFDITMIVLTSGIWLLWIFIREMRAMR